MTTHPRTAWQSPAQPVTGPPIDWARVDTVVVHYTAAKDCPEGADRAAYGAFLRAMQNDYLTTRGYSLGYSVAVATVGESWQIRGADLKPAATKNHNDHTWAILLTVDADAPASPAAVAEVRRLVAEAERLAGRTLAIKGHGELGATACPGAGIRRQIAEGVFRPVPNPPPPPPIPEDDDMTTACIVRIKGWWNAWLIGTGPALHLTPELLELYRQRGVQVVVVANHPQLRKSLQLQSGTTEADMVPSGGS